MLTGVLSSISNEKRARAGSKRGTEQQQKAAEEAKSEHCLSLAKRKPRATTQLHGTTTGTRERDRSKQKQHEPWSLQTTMYVVCVVRACVWMT